MDKKREGTSGDDHAGAISGSIQISQDVVETIAGLAAKGIDGIHSLGRSRLFRLTKNGDPTRGISAEVGQKEAAFDLEVIIEYGYDIRVVANQLRQRIAREVDRMAGRTVVDVNIKVVGLHIPSEDKPVEAPRIK